MNSNFTAVATAVNNIYPSQILPLTSGQATFGATATGVGYKFLANDATATPLTISGVTSQSVDILDVTLTSGGTKAVFVNSGGALVLGATNGGLPSGPSLAGTAGGALILNTTASQALFFASGVGAVTTLGQFTTSATLAVGATPTGPTVAGSIITSTGAAAGQVGFGSGAAWATIDYGVTTAGTYTLLKTAGVAYAPMNGGLYQNLSDAAFKSDLHAVPYGLTAVLALKPSRYTMNGNAELGFIAQDVQAILPEIVNADGKGNLLMAYSGVIPVLAQAIQDMCGKLKTAGVAGF